MAHIDFRGSSQKKPWRVQIRKKGFPSMQKAFASRVEAETWASITEDGLEKSKQIESISLPEVPLSVWISRWIEEVGPKRSYLAKEKKQLDFWKHHLGNETAIKISPTIIESVADLLLKQKSSRGEGNLSPETRRKHLLILSSIYSHAMRVWKWCIFNPLTGVNMVRKEESIGKDITKGCIPEFDETIKRFSALIKNEMIKKDLSQRDAARMSNMSIFTFQCAVLKNNNLNLKTMIKILNAFGLKLEIHEK